jgi:hypothetical protein
MREAIEGRAVTGVWPARAPPPGTHVAEAGGRMKSLGFARIVLKDRHPNGNHRTERGPRTLWQLGIQV